MLFDLAMISVLKVNKLIPNVSPQKHTMTSFTEHGISNRRVARIEP